MSEPITHLDTYNYTNLSPTSTQIPLKSHSIPPVPLLTFMYVIVVVIYIFILYIQPNVFLFYTCCTLPLLYMYQCDGPHGHSILNQLNHYTVCKQ